MCGHSKFRLFQLNTLKLIIHPHSLISNLYSKKRKRIKLQILLPARSLLLINLQTKESLLSIFLKRTLIMLATLQAAPVEQASQRVLLLVGFQTMRRPNQNQSFWTLTKSKRKLLRELRVERPKKWVPASSIFPRLIPVSTNLTAAESSMTISLLE